MNYKLFAFLLVGLCLFCGCGKNAKISGKVTFPDGSPLTVGEVRFDSGSKTASGVIKSDGTFVLGSTSETDGIPAGEYGVCIVRAYSRDTGEQMEDPSQASPAMPLIAPKFESSLTSGLKCTVKGSTTYNITVEAP